jgi:hypothetical protein
VIWDIKVPHPFLPKKGGKRDFVTWESMAREKDKGKTKHTRTPTHTHEAIHLLAGKPDEPFACSGGQSDNMPPKNIKNMIHHSKAQKINKKKYHKKKILNKVLSNVFWPHNSKYGFIVEGR